MQLRVLDSSCADLPWLRLPHLHLDLTSGTALLYNRFEFPAGHSIDCLHFICCEIFIVIDWVCHLMNPVEIVMSSHQELSRTCVSACVYVKERERERSVCVCASDGWMVD